MFYFNMSLIVFCYSIFTEFRALPTQLTVLGHIEIVKIYTLEVRNFEIFFSKFRIRVWEKNEIRNFENKNFEIWFRNSYSKFENFEILIRNSEDFEILIRKFDISKFGSENLALTEKAFNNHRPTKSFW